MNKYEFKNSKNVIISEIKFIFLNVKEKNMDVLNKIKKHTNLTKFYINK